ncbi:MAG: hypothetical protein D6773_18300, partial [Alphaproteobacteria bacterium]
GGVGKTVLAAALARDCEVRRSFPDGIYWVELNKEPNIALRMRTLGEALGDDGDKYQDIESGRIHLSALLEKKAALIILDDAWDYDHAAAFHIVGNRSRIVITTRSRRIVNQFGIAPQEVEMLSEDEGLALIAERLGLAAEDDNPYETEHRAIVTSLGGHAQAIALAAAKIAENGRDYAPDLLRRIEKRRGGETPFRPFTDGETRQFNLEVMFSLSYEDLSADEQRRFRALGVFAPGGSFHPVIAQVMWGDDDLDDTTDCLRHFVNAALLTDDGGRYTLHALLHDYARALLLREGELPALEAQHFAVYNTLHGNYNTNNDEDRHPLIRADFENIQQALQWGFEHQPQTACDFVYALTYYMQFHVPMTLQHTLLTAAYQSVKDDTEATQQQANTLKALGDLSLRQAELSAARGYYDRALPLYEA